MNLTVIPLGGLANRMLALASGVWLSRTAGVDLRCAWRCVSELNAPFTSLFEPLQGVRMIHPGVIDRILLYDVPRRRNMHLPSISQRMRYATRLFDSPSIYRYLDDPGLVAEELDRCVAAGRSMLVATGYEFYDFPDTLPAELFHPVAAIEEAIARTTDRLGNFPVGVHIRRTDHRIAIDRSPTSLFVERMKRIVDADADTVFFLATDSEEEKITMRRTFGDRRIVTAERPAARNSLSGMRDAVADLYTLSRTNLVLGSAGSTFGAFAARIGNIKFEVISRDGAARR